ncbi:MAG: LysM peptidoglycan-binding domain-containing protein, partial [Bacteroidota bacterium]
MAQLFRSGTLTLFLLFSSTFIFAQYEPDTSLTYSDFLKQCVQFKKTPRQEVWVVHFWASWSGASINDIDRLKAAKIRHSNKPIRFISISDDKVPQVWAKAITELQMPWEQLLLKAKPDYEFLKRAFPHRSYPAVFVVNSNGQIRRTLDMDDFDAVLAGLAPNLPNRPYQSSSLNSGFGELKPGREIGSAPIAAVEAPISETDPVSEKGAPEGGSDWLMHTVKTGETLFSLYRKYGVKVDEIKSLNRLSSNTIKVGQVLKIRPS